VPCRPEELLDLFPLIKLGAEGAVILHPAFKIKIAGGMNFPGTGVVSSGRI
jgi:hypothetical protein